MAAAAATANGQITPPPTTLQTLFVAWGSAVSADIWKGEEGSAF